MPRSQPLLQKRVWAAVTSHANAFPVLRRCSFALAFLAAFAVVSGFAASFVSAGEPVWLTSDGRLKQDPVFLKDGEELVYVEQFNAVQLRLVRLTLATGHAAPVHENETKNEYEPSFSPDGKWLAVIRSQGNLSLAIVLKELQENREFRIDPTGGFCGYRSPAISPDGASVLYSFADGGRQQIFSANMRGENRQPLTDSRGVNNWPNWSPNGRQIVFGSSRDDDFEIYRMDANGAHVVRLTESPGQDLRPRYSPDGRRIAFTSNRDGNYELYLMNSDGTGLVRLTDSPERDDYAAWHPSGKRLAYVAEHKGRFDLRMIDVPDGSVR